MAEEEAGGPVRFLPDSLQALMVKQPGMAGGADGRSTLNLLTGDHSQRSTLNSMGAPSRGCCRGCRRCWGRCIGCNCPWCAPARLQELPAAAGGARRAWGRG